MDRTIILEYDVVKNSKCKIQNEKCKSRYAQPIYILRFLFNILHLNLKSIIYDRTFFNNHNAVFDGIQRMVRII